MIKRPRQHNEAHLKFVRGLPCCVCGNPIETEAAHIRYARNELGKRPVGKGEKPDDVWTVPLCGHHHRDQHYVGEEMFWHAYPRNPILIALALWAHTGQHEVGEQIVRAAHD